MSACGSLHQIFENPLPENPTFLESLSWNQIKPLRSLEESSSFTELFGELHFKESPQSSSPSSSSSSPHNEVSGSSSESDINKTQSSAYVPSTPIKNHTNSHKSSNSFSSLNSESLQLCTEGLGFESSVEVEELRTGIMNECREIQRQREAVKKQLASDSEEYCCGEYYCRRSLRVSEGEYPPPISCIGRSGKPWVCFKSYRNNGRFVLKEIRIPTQEFLHAYREDGRLKLHFVQPNDEYQEEGEKEEEGEEGDADSIYEEEEDVNGIDEEEENMGKENVGCVTEQVNEEKHIEA